jgi:hypothetical protein
MVLICYYFRKFKDNKYYVEELEEKMFEMSGIFTTVGT